MMRVERDIAMGHPATQGHFPLHPILPGAYLLDAAIQAAAAQFGFSTEHVVAENVKFSRPVLPGCRIVLLFDEPLPVDAGQRVRFQVQVQDTQVTAGSLLFRELP